MAKKKGLTDMQVIRLVQIKGQLVNIFCSSEMYKREVKASNIHLMLDTAIKNINSVLDADNKIKAG